MTRGLRAAAESAEGKHYSPLALCLFLCLLVSLGQEQVTQHRYRVRTRPKFRIQQSVQYIFIRRDECLGDC
jgi:hypothetical protein